MRESKNGFVILDHMGFFTTEKTEDPKKDHLPRRQHALVPLVKRKIAEKIQQTDPHGEDKREKQQRLLMNIRNLYILV